MKRLICFVLALLFIPSLAFAEFNESSLYGVWVNISSSSNNSTGIRLFHFMDTHYVYYHGQSYNPKNPHSVTFDSNQSMIKWELENDKITVYSDKGVYQELYFVNSFCLSSKPDGAGSLFYKADDPNESKDDDSSPTLQPESMINASDASPANYDPVGMWSFFWDARELNERLGKKRMSFDIETYNLYLFDDGSAYLTNCEVLNGKKDFSYGALDGIWIGDASDMTIKVGDTTYKAWINDEGYLYLKMTDSMAFIMRRIENYNYKDGILK